VKDLRQLLRVRDFRLLWFAQIGSDFGDNLTFLSLMILVERLTGSAAALAGLLIASALPSLVFGVVAGVYADRFDRKKTMVVSDALRAVLILGLIFIQSADQLPLMYVIAFAQATIGTLFNPSRNALLPALVDEDQLLAANSVSQSSRVVFNVLGSATAGILASVTDTMTIPFVVDSLSFAASALLISRIAATSVPKVSSHSRVWSDMTEGFQFMLGSRPLIGVLVGAGLAMLGFGAVNVLTVPMLIDDLQVSEVYLGMIEAAQVIGMIAAGALVAVVAMRLKASHLVSLGLIGAGLAIALVAVVTNAWQMTGVAVLVGLAITPAQSGVSTLSQTLVEDRMRGRVGGALNAVISGATIASMAFAGIAAGLFGVRNVFVISGAIAAAGGVAAWFLFRGVDAPAGGRAIAVEAV
jgi:MFS transporter, DHA3 family, macrolide efflux protein